MTLILFDAPSSNLRSVPASDAQPLIWKGVPPLGTTPLLAFRPWLVADLITRTLSLENGHVGFTALPVNAALPVPKGSPDQLSAVGITDVQWLDHEKGHEALSSERWAVRGFSDPGDADVRREGGSEHSSIDIVVSSEPHNDGDAALASLSLDQALSDYEGLTLRYALIRRVHYRSPLILRPDELESASGKMGYFYGTLQRCAHFLEDNERDLHGVLPRQALMDDLRSGVISALHDDLNLTSALLSINLAFTALNELLGSRTPAKRAVAAVAMERILGIVQELDSVFGLFGETPEAFLLRHRTRGAQRRGLDETVIERQIAARIAARTARDWTLADRIGAELGAQGVVLMDHPGGTHWRLSLAGASQVDEL